MKKTIINFCPTGMVPTKETNPNVPISPNEVVEQTHEAFELGITIAHFHARTADGIPTYHASVYRDIFEGVRKHCPELVICGSSSGRRFPEFEKRSEVLELMPDMCSLTLASMNFSRSASVNDPEMIRKLALKMNEYGVHPELECFDMGMVNYGLYLIRKGILIGPYYWNLLFGNIAGFQSSLSQMGAAIQEIPHDHFIGLAGIGENQLKVNAIALAMGYGVRVGLEDNPWWDEERTKAATNIELIRRIHQLMDIHGRELLTAAEFGSMGFYNRKGRQLDS